MTNEWRINCAVSYEWTTLSRDIKILFGLNELNNIPLFILDKYFCPSKVNKK
jgi:hypothetical protein